MTIVHGEATEHYPSCAAFSALSQSCGLLGRQGLRAAAFIEPSNHEGFYWVDTLVEGAFCGTNRPVAVAGIVPTLTVMGVTVDDMVWSEQAQTPRSSARFADTRQLPKRREQGSIYFLQSVDGGPIKIGWAMSVPSRVAEIQRMSPICLRVLTTLPGSMADETTWHRRFDHLRLHGEWFQDADELLAAITAEHYAEEEQRIKELCILLACEAGELTEAHATDALGMIPVTLRKRKHDAVREGVEAWRVRTSGAVAAD